MQNLIVGKAVTGFSAFVNEVVPAADLITRAEAILQHIFANAPIAVKFSLEAVNKGLETSLAEGLSLKAALFGLCAGTEDKKEGTQAFLQKRAREHCSRSGPPPCHYAVTCQGISSPSPWAVRSAARRTARCLPRRSCGCPPWREGRGTGAQGGTQYALCQARISAPPHGKGYEPRRRIVRCDFGRRATQTSSLGQKQITDLFNRGTLTARVGTVLPLEQARTAPEMLGGAPHSRGKIVLPLEAPA